MKTVQLISADTEPYQSLTTILQRVISENIKEWEARGEVVAIKCHFGEAGATRYVRPIFLRAIVEALKGAGMIPFATDSGVLYHSPRNTAPMHLEVAYQNGFTPYVIGCPIIIADGLFGESHIRIPSCLPGSSRQFQVAAVFALAKHLIVLSHVTFHGFTGVAGAIKNVGMGCMAAAGKALVHENTKPAIAAEKCNGCGLCLSRCSRSALTLAPKITRDDELCTGCCHCLGPCREGVFSLTDEQLREFNRTLVEAAASFLSGRKALFVNGVMDVAPQCDCASFTNRPPISDVGFVIADDALLADRGSVALIEKEKPLNPELKRLWEHQLEFAEQIFDKGEIEWKIIKK